MKSQTKTASGATGSNADTSSLFSRILREGVLILTLAACAYLGLTLITYDPHDPGWFQTGTSQAVANAGGPAGAWLADVFFSVFGLMAFLFPLMLAYQAWCVLRDKRNLRDPLLLAVRFVGLCLIMVAGTGLAAQYLSGSEGTLPFSSGGILGLGIAEAADSTFGLVGSSLLLLASFLFGLTIFVDLSWIALMEFTGRSVLSLGAFIKHRFTTWSRNRKERKEVAEVVQKRRESIKEHTKKLEQRVPPTITALPKPPAPSPRVQKEKQQSLFDMPVTGSLPPISLLDAPNKTGSKGYSAESLEAMSRLLELKLKDFGIIAEVTEVLPGPVVTRFEIQPAPGVKVSRITNLAKDLARSLAVISVRVVEVIEGKSVVGIEIPNQEREMVRLSEVISSAAYDKSRSPLTLALGHDISGQPVVADLAKMPHLLVAGTTGSGKSVGVNAMLLSVLYKATPEDVRLLLVDPKMLELSVYEGIPHLLAPVITDMKDAATGLRWCVGEMERRYKLMAALGVRNLAGYNKKVGDANKAGTPIADPLWRKDESGIGEEQAPNLETLPFIVVVIDEFADMMMIVGKKVEQLIARIAQKARAAGIHMILATQRPSVDVITGLIKANIPTRIAFQVSSKIDSRTILDQGGAEQLLGHGDMLYLPPGTSLPVRVHGAFVDDHEVHNVVADWKRRGTPNYLEEIFSEATETTYIPGFSEEGSGGGEGDSESDPLYDEAVAFVTESRKASISAVQRKLRIGYNRAARLIEQMEASGVVSEMSSNGNREVLAPPPPR
ncbi:DNA translocase FtsK [Saccharophagus sp. K07]|uniref:DNA translocase FtsK n=1 Tax=Saccharophagus sp. K07 TaxID=2283636 RepID=UPI001652AC87|nr:DNA translocase FtsK [Saccharophagus sp. K07]MBC6904914.1 DNA translocase FtsK [Saccharophagus sp. K07]